MKAEVVSVGDKEVIVKSFGVMKIDLSELTGVTLKKGQEFEGRVAGGTFIAEKEG